MFFKVVLFAKEYTWMKFEFKFGSLEDAQEFVNMALTHYAKKDADDNILVVNISYEQQFSTEENDD